MKKLLMIAAMALSTAALAEMSLADARAQIGEAVASPAKMAEIMQQLSAEDQVAFLAAVNAAIDLLPGSGDEKAAKFLDANTVAMKNNKGNLKALLAETFATVPAEALTVINERFASDLFNRAADPSRPVSDAEFTALAKETMATVNERASKTDESAVRDTFAILMFLRASNGSPADLRTTLAEVIADNESRNLALTEWIPSAMGEGIEKTYEPMLGASDAGAAPAPNMVLMLASSEGMLPLLGDLASKNPAFLDSTINIGNVDLSEWLGISGIDRIPRTLDKRADWYSGYRRGEPSGYAYQDL